MYWGICRRPRRRSDPSGAPEPDRHLPLIVDDDGNAAAAVAVAEHPLQLCGVLLDVDVFEIDMPPCVVVPGGLRVGSGVLAEDVDHTIILRRPPQAVEQLFRPIR